jgi:hypothetical protein
MTEYYFPVMRGGITLTASHEDVKSELEIDRRNLAIQITLSRQDLGTHPLINRLAVKYSMHE